MTRLVLGAGLAAMLVGSARADIVEQILVKVNGEIITKTDLEQRQVLYLRQRNQKVSDLDLENDAELQKILLEITPQLIAEAVDELLLVQRGKELGFRLTDDRFKEILENIRKENRLESEEQFQAALKQEGMTLADLRRSLERQMLISGVQSREVFGKIGVSDDEARVYYEAHADEFTTPPAVSLREILIRVEPVTAPGSTQPMVNVGREEEALERINKARARILAGEDFAAVAAEVSEAPSKANSGLIGPIRRSEIAPALLAMLDKMKVGDVTDVIKTPAGFQLLKLESATEPVLQPFDQARDQIADKVFDSKRRAELGRYLQKLRAQAIIEWKNDELRKVYEQHIAATQSPS